MVALEIQNDQIFLNLGTWTMLWHLRACVRASTAVVLVVLSIDSTYAYTDASRRRRRRYAVARWSAVTRVLAAIAHKRLPGVLLIHREAANTKGNKGRTSKNGGGGYS